MKYCKTCLNTDTRPNSFFSKDGICPACIYYSKLKEVDWEERFDLFKNIIKNNQNKNNSYYDCIIGVSGGKDSTRQALWAREKLGIRPLLVCLTYPPEQVTDCGVNNLSNLIEHGFDFEIISLGPQTWKRTLREGFLQFTNFQKAAEIAIISAVPVAAIKHKINLILWGENPGLQLGDMKTVGKTGYDGNQLRFMNTVAGGDLTWLLSSGVKKENLIHYKYPNPEEFDAANIQIIYMGWFWRDWSLMNNGMYSVTNGIEIRDKSVKETGDITRVTSLDEDWVTLNQMIKYYKYGFGRVADHVNEEIRSGGITREKGIEILEKYDGLCSAEYIESFCSYIDITVERFWDIVKKSVNKSLFSIESDGSIKRLFKVGKGI